MRFKVGTNKEYLDLDEGHMNGICVDHEMRDSF